MWKKIIFLFLFLLNTSLSAASQHLAELKKAFPYGLLTDDFGILTEVDLKINSCVAQARAFDETSHDYPYWQCFESKTAKLNCEIGPYDTYEKKRMALLVVSARLNTDLHEYLAKRTISIKECQAYKNEWQRLLREQQYICVSGTFNLKQYKDNVKSLVWIFDRYKTKKGWEGSSLNDCTH